MVQIQSSWFPLVDRNPQQFLGIPNAKAADFQKATERIYRGGEDGSGLRPSSCCPKSLAAGQAARVDPCMALRGLIVRTGPLSIRR